MSFYHENDWNRRPGSGFFVFFFPELLPGVGLKLAQLWTSGAELTVPTFVAFMVFHCQPLVSRCIKSSYDLYWSLCKYNQVITITIGIFQVSWPARNCTDCAYSWCGKYRYRSCSMQRSPLKWRRGEALSGNHFVLAMASDKVGSPVSSLAIWMPDQKSIVQLSLTRLTSRLMQLT